MSNDISDTYNPFENLKELLPELFELKEILEKNGKIILNKHEIIELSKYICLFSKKCKYKNKEFGYE